MNEKSPNFIRIIVFLVACLGMAACQSPRAAGGSGGTNAAPGSAPTEAVPQASPTSPLVTGAIRISDGEDVVTGTAGQPLQVTVHFSASSPAGPVTQMREARVPGCAADMSNSAAWEPFAPQKVYTIPNPPAEITAFDVSVQYRDSQENMSLFYCEDGAIQGVQTTPTP
jgi:hypothetical protein